MKRTVSGIILTLLLAGMLTSAVHIQIVKAAPTTITVPDNYSTIQAAINAATNGDTIFVRNGEYSENIVVNKTISLVGEERDNTVIAPGLVIHPGNIEYACALDILANNVSVSGFTIQGAGPTHAEYWGIVLESNGSTVVNNTILDIGYGVQFSYVAYNILENNLLGACGCSLSLSGSWDNVIRNNMMNSGEGGPGIGAIGIYLAGDSDNALYNNTITNNYYGIILQDGGNNIVIENNISNNSYGLYLICDGYPYNLNNNIYHNTFSSTSQQVVVQNSVKNNFDNGFEGNYWSDYNGTDSNGDGIGDTPYVIDANNIDHYPLMNIYHEWWNPCDINHDLKVDMRDLGASARAFDTVPGNSLWNPHADITGPLGVPDGKVDMRDIGLTARHFGQHYP